jgi:ankyrin repeat protein
VLAFASAPFASSADEARPARPARAVPAAEDPALAEAEMAVRLHEPARAVRLWRTAAERGHPEAAYRLGVAYRSGLGVDKDVGQAARWLRVAAERGHADAQYALGVLLQNGTGIARDPDEAIRLFGLAARSGHRRAQERLGQLNRRRSQGYALADARIAANRGDPRASLAQAIRRDDARSAREALARGAPVDGAPGDRDHWRPLILAIERGNAEMVGVLLDHRADPNVRSRSGDPALVLAVRSEDESIAKRLLRAGAAPDRRASNGTTPLMEAARLGRTRVARDLLAAKADPGLVLDDGTSAADVARRFGHDALARELARRGAPLREAEEGRTRLAALDRRSARGPAERSLPPVVEAARRGDARLLGEMVDRGLDLTARDPDGENALTRAADLGRVEALRILLAAGVDPDLRGGGDATALLKAMASRAEGTDVVVDLLASAGADVHARDAAGRGVIEYAARGATKSKLGRIREAGASWTEAAVRGALVEAAAADRLGVVEALLPFATADDARVDALCRATERGHVRIVDRLARAKSPLEGDCGEGLTPLAVAAQSGSLELATKLIGLGARPDAGPAARDTALIAAAGRGHLSLVDLLLRGGADPDRRGLRRMTPLMAAAAKGHADVVERLLEAGAHRGMRSDTEQTALDLARQAGHPDVVAAIERRGSSWRDWLGTRSDAAGPAAGAAAASPSDDR